MPFAVCPKSRYQRHIEPLEARALLSGGVGVQTTSPPVVYGVYLNSSEWTAAFKQSIQQLDFGYADRGVGIGPTSVPAHLPWANVDQITIHFSTDMIVEARHLRVFGTNVSQYPVASFEYHLETFNYDGFATWTLARPLGADKLLLQLDAHSPDGVRQSGTNIALDGDRDGQPGGDFRQRFDSLPGDGASGRVDFGDVWSIRTRVGSNVLDPGPAPRYHPINDITGDGQINAHDLAEVRRRVGTALPEWEPTGSVVVQSSGSTRIRPATRSLFGSARILH